MFTIPTIMRLTVHIQKLMLLAVKKLPNKSVAKHEKYDVLLPARSFNNPNK